MANEKNNINELVTDDDDPTSELEALTWQHAPRDVELESDASTCDFERRPNGRDAGSITELRTDLRRRGETIESLQFDIEQLRARWLGLETEIKAREEITDQLRGDLEVANEAISRKSQLIAKRDQAIKSLKAEIRERDERYRELEMRNAGLEARHGTQAGESDAAKAPAAPADPASRTGDDEIVSLRREIADLAHYVDARRDSWEHSRRSLASLGRQLAERDLSVRRLSAELDRARRVSADLERALAEKHRSVHDRDERIHALTTENARLAADLRSPAEQRLEAARRDIDLLSGRLAGRDAEIAEARERLGTMERYADTLRSDLTDQLRAYEELDGAYLALEHMLNGMVERADALEAELAVVRDRADAVEAAAADVEERHAREIRTLRFELGDAQETASRQELISEQLAADLADTRTSKNDLARQLADSEALRAAGIEALEKEVARLRHSVDDYQAKLDTRNEAINCLLSELAKKSQQLETIVGIEDVIQDIGDRMSERLDDKRGTERERVTRVLIGKVDDQELRFPLFKDRLTIGRTRNNDIQLKAPHISRRHAVIATEGDSTRVIDWGSKNGVYVNSERVTEHFLKNGDVLVIGVAEFRYEERPKRDA